ncbi:hypothetical protein COOONC_21414 [Cooperia oncophora]
METSIPILTRIMLGYCFRIDGYLVTTIDKLIAMVGRQLHFLATGTEGLETMKLYQRFRYDLPLSVFNQSARKTRVEEEYSRAAETFFNCQNCFKIYVIYEKKPVVTIELVDTETEEDNGDGENIQPNGETTADGSTDDDSDHNEETDEDQRRNGTTVRAATNGLSTKKDGITGVAGPSTVKLQSVKFYRSPLPQAKCPHAES